MWSRSSRGLWFGGVRPLASRNFCARTSPQPFGKLFSCYYATVPKDLKYAKTHEWLRLEGEVGTVGITDFAQDALGEVVFVDLPDKGAVLKKNQAFGAMESVKTASDLYTPVSGVVVEVNTQLKDGDVTLVNKEPYGKGWLIKLKPSSKSEVADLLDATTYETHCASEKDHH